MKKSKPRKVLGPDNIHKTAIKLLEEDNLELLEKLLKNIYATRKIPQLWLTSAFINLTFVNLFLISNRFVNLTTQKKFNDF